MVSSVVIAWAGDTGIDALLHARNRALVEGSIVQLRGVPDRVRKILGMTGVAGMFTTYGPLA